jgi:hypothetical protein
MSKFKASLFDKCVDVIKNGLNKIFSKAEHAAERTSDFFIDISSHNEDERISRKVEDRVFKFIDKLIKTDDKSSVEKFAEAFHSITNDLEHMVETIGDSVHND